MRFAALRGIYSAISVLVLTTENPGSGCRVKIIESYTSQFLTRHFLLVISCTRDRILYRK